VQVSIAYLVGIGELDEARPLFGSQLEIQYQQARLGAASRPETADRIIRAGSANDAAGKWASAQALSNDCELTLKNITDSDFPGRAGREVC
jgi:hypothetical protein